MFAGLDPASPGGTWDAGAEERLRELEELNKDLQAQVQVLERSLLESAQHGTFLLQQNEALEAQNKELRHKVADEDSEASNRRKLDFLASQFDQDMENLVEQRDELLQRTQKLERENDSLREQLRAETPPAARTPQRPVVEDEHGHAFYHVVRELQYKILNSEWQTEMDAEVTKSLELRDCLQDLEMRRSADVETTKEELLELTDELERLQEECQQHSDIYAEMDQELSGYAACSHDMERQMHELWHLHEHSRIRESRRHEELPKPSPSPRNDEDGQGSLHHQLNTTPEALMREVAELRLRVGEQRELQRECNEYRTDCVKLQSGVATLRAQTGRLQEEAENARRAEAEAWHYAEKQRKLVESVEALRVEDKRLREASAKAAEAERAARRGAEKELARTLGAIRLMDMGIVA